MQAGNTATTTTAHQSLMEDDSSTIFSYPSTAQASNSATTTTANQSLTENDSPADPFMVQADNNTTTTFAHQSLPEGDIQSDGNPDATEHSGNLPSSSTEPIF